MGKKSRIISQPRHDRSSMSQARAIPPLLSSRSGSLARQRRLKRRKSPITEAPLWSANLGQRPSHEMNSWPVSKVSLHPERNGGPFSRLLLCYSERSRGISQRIWKRVRDVLIHSTVLPPSRQATARLSLGMTELICARGATSRSTK